MARIYSPPTELPAPQPDYANFDWQKIESDYLVALAAWCKSNGQGDVAGETVHFPVADGHATYMVFSEKPLTLIHVPLGDAWQYQYANRLRLSDVREEVRRNKSIAKLFGRAS